MLLPLLALAAGAGGLDAQPAAVDRPILSAGPVLVGDRVVWGETTFDAMFLLLRSPGTGPVVIYRQRSSRRKQSWGVDDIAASPSFLAFSRSWEDCGGGVCGYGGSDLWAGGPRGPFSRYASAPYLPCGSGVSFDVDSSAIVFSEHVCRRGAERARVVLRWLPRGPEVELANLPAKAYCCGDVRIAGRFVAWAAGKAIVVYDVVARRTAYRAGLPKGSQRALDFDLTDDGRLVVAIDNRRGIVDEDQVPIGKLFRFAPGAPAPRARSIGGQARLDWYGRRLRIGGGRLLYDRALTAKTSELVFVDRAGRRRRLAFFHPGERLVGDLDLTPERIAWASRRDTQVRQTCNIERCTYVADGVITVWTARLGGPGIRRTQIARRPYSGLSPLD